MTFPAYDPNDPNDVAHHALQDPVMNLRRMRQHIDAVLHLSGRKRTEMALHFARLAVHISNEYELTEIEVEELSRRPINQQLSEEEWEYWLKRMNP